MARPRHIQRRQLADSVTQQATDPVRQRVNDLDDAAARSEVSYWIGPWQQDTLAASNTEALLFHASITPREFLAEKPGRIAAVTVQLGAEHTAGTMRAQLLIDGDVAVDHTFPVGETEYVDTLRRTKKLIYRKGARIGWQAVTSGVSPTTLDMVAFTRLAEAPE